MSSGTVVSHHFLRRTARAYAAALRLRVPGVYRVESLVRGPFGWKVVRRG